MFTVCITKKKKKDNIPLSACPWVRACIADTVFFLFSFFCICGVVWKSHANSKQPPRRRAHFSTRPRGLQHVDAEPLGLSRVVRETLQLLRMIKSRRFADLSPEIGAESP